MKKKLIIGGVIAVVIIAIVAANIIKNSGGVPTFSSSKVYDIKVKNIEKGDISSTVSATGVIEEIDKAVVYFDTPLKITKVLVEKNQKITKGQKLIELDMDSLNSELEQLKITRSVQELGIKKVRTLDGTRSTAALEAAITMAENNVKSAESTYNDSVKNLEKYQSLFKAGAVSQSDYDRVVKTESDTKIALENAKQNYNTALDNLAEAKKSNSQSSDSKNIDVETQEQNLKSTILRIADLENKIKKINDNTMSPIDGVITEVNVQDGGFTSSMQEAFRILNPDRLQIKADVKEFDIKNVAIGQKVMISGDAIDKADEVIGKIASISSTAKKNRTTTGDETLIEVTVAIEKSHPVLKPGLSVTCDIVTNDKKGVVLATFEMLKEDKDGNKLVFVVDTKNNVMNEKPIKLGVTSDLNAEVLEGLKEGDTVVVDLQPNYKDGAKVRIKKDEKK